MMIDGNTDFFDDEEDFSITPIDPFQGNRHKVVPEGMGKANAAGHHTRPPPGVIRRVMAEVAMGQYDAVLVYDHLQHLTPGSIEFNEIYVKLHLERLTRTREAKHRSYALASKRQSLVPDVPWITAHWTVKSFADLISLGGAWVSLLAIGQLSVACYLGKFLEPWLVFTWPANAGFIVVVYLALDVTAFLLLRGRAIFKWLVPALWLTAATVLPACAVYLVKTILALYGSRIGTFTWYR
jgi:hypothetical protein